MVRLRVTYHRAQDLVADHDQQFGRGGLLVKVPDVHAERGAPVELELVTDFGQVTVSAHVIQLLGAAGVAVGFDPGTVELSELVQAAREAGSTAGRAPEHAVVGMHAAPGSASAPAPSPRTRSARPVKAQDGGDNSGDSPTTGPEAQKRTFTRRPRQQRAGDARARIRNASPAEKIQIALHGSKDERVIIIRDTNRRLHQYVIRNPQIQLDEVAAIARMTTVSVDILKFIAGRREWARRPEIASSLVRNVKMPVPLAVSLINFVSPSELRQLAKMSGVRAPIQRAARKKLLTK